VPKGGLVRQSLHILAAETLLMMGMIMVWRLLDSRICLAMAILCFVVIGGTFYFFRDPERQIPVGNGIVVSPADGKIVEMKDKTHLPFHDSSLQRVSIFLSLWDVHVNRIPVSGKVVHFSYRPGRFLPAFFHKSSNRNEQNIIGIQGSTGVVFVKQIAGMLARRIVCRLRVGDEVQQGERFGMIRFGSRVEVYVPSSIHLSVSEGDRIRAGVSIIGDIHEA
jgi:phosphatidylserine decarboxylase